MTQEERDNAILAERLNGAAWDAIAGKFGLSAQRCQQICIAAAKAGKTTNDLIRYRPQPPKSAA